MQQTSALYKQILATEYIAHYKMNVYSSNGQTSVGSFGDDRIVALSIERSLFKDSSPGVGGTVVGQLDVQFLPWDDDEQDVTIPRMAKLVISVAISGVVGGVERTSEWLQMGVFWVDTRETDDETGVMKLQAFDAMLKGEQLFCDDGVVERWPRTDIQVLNGFTSGGVTYPGITQKLGVGIDSASLALIDKGYTIQFPGTVQTQGQTETSLQGAAMTVREVLGYICAAYACNATISESGELRLVPLKAQTAVHTLGINVGEFSTIPAFSAFGRVEVVVSSEASYFYPAQATSGRTLTVECLWGTQQMAQNIYNLVNGYAYHPFAAEDALMDPAAQMGDGVTVNGVTGVIYAVSWEADALFAANISAPQDEEVDHEYPFVSRQNRETEREIAETRASLIVTADSIAAEVMRAQGAEDALRTQISIVAGEVSSKISSSEAQSMIDQSATSILAEVSDNYYGKQSFISIESNTVEIGSGGSFIVNAGADIQMTGNNFSVDSSGNMSITGTLTAAKVYASNVVTGSAGGSLGSNSDYLSNIWFGSGHLGSGNLWLGSNYYINGTGVTHQIDDSHTEGRTWQSIINGGAAVWG